jgi:hypothetical protein
MVLLVASAVLSFALNEEIMALVYRSGHIWFLIGTETKFVLKNYAQAYSASRESLTQKKKRKKRKRFQRGWILWMQAFRLKNFPFHQSKGNIEGINLEKF